MRKRKGKKVWVIFRGGNWKRILVDKQISLSGEDDNEANSVIKMGKTG